MENTRKLTTTALLVAISAVLALGLYVLPVIQSAIFIIALPLIVIGVIYDHKVQILGMIVLGFLLLTIDPYYACMVILLAGPLSVVQGYLIKKKTDSSEIIFYGTVTFVFGILLLLYLTNAMMGISLVDELSLYTADMVEELKIMYTNTSMLEAEDLQTFLAGLDELKEYVVLLMPTFIVFFSFASSILSFVVVRTILNRIGQPVKMTYFKDFRIEKNKRVTLVIVMLVVTAVSFMDKSNTDYYIINFMSILIVLFQINGLAVIWYLTEKHPNKKAVRIITIIAFFISPVIAFLELIVRYGFALIGLLDMSVDFRKKIENKKSLR